MRDYVNIITKIKNTPWLITPEALEVILGIVDAHVYNKGSMTDEQIRVRINGNGLATGEHQTEEYGNDIGVLPLYGPIFGKANMMTELSGATSMEMFNNNLDELLNDSNIKAIIMDVDSPGGTADMIQETGEKIKSASETKPIYAIANGTAGSAAYWLASQATELYTTSSGMVGSIGVYTVHEDVSGADQQAGHKFTYISAGPYKTEGNPHEPITAEGRRYLQEIVDECYEDFIEAVSKGRGVDAADVQEHFGGGRLVTARKALENGMVDGIVTLDALVNRIQAETPQVVSVEIPGAMHAVGGLLHKGRVIISDNSVNLTSTNYNIPIRTESKEMEHSEPGISTPPPPRTNEDGHDDPAIVGGWRGDGRLPVDPNDPGAPKPDSMGGKMTAEQEAELRVLLGLDDSGDIVAAVEQLNSELAPLREAVSASNEESEFAKRFPSIYRKHQTLVDAHRNSQAQAFVQEVFKVKKPESDGYKDTNFAMSALAMETVEQTYIKAATGTISLSDFTSAIESIMNGGILEYGERGSSISTEPIGIDVSTSVGIKEVRKQFAAKVTEIMNKDNLTYNDAITRASQLYPDLAQAYQVSGVPR